MKPKLVPDHEGTYINMQRLIQVQGEHVVTGVPARYVMGLIEELNAAKQSERVLREALEWIATDFEMDFVLDDHVVDAPATSHIAAWKAARIALAPEPAQTSAEKAGGK